MRPHLPGKAGFSKKLFRFKANEAKRDPFCMRFAFEIIAQIFSLLFTLFASDDSEIKLSFCFTLVHFITFLFRFILISYASKQKKIHVVCFFCI